MATNAGEIVQRYFQAFGSGDGATARSLLKDDLYFKGPIDEFHNADDLMSSLQKLAQIVKGVEPRKTFVDGDDVCMIYDLVTNTPAGTSAVAEWHHVENGKIAAIRVYFDARPFAAMFEKH